MNENQITTFTNISLVLLDEVLEHFKTITQIRSEATFKNYQTTIRQFLNWLQDHQISQPGMEDVLAWKADLKERGFKPRTINNQLTALRKFFQYLAFTGRYPDITGLVKNEKQDAEFIRDYFTSDQIHEVVQHCLDKEDLKGLRDACVLLLMASTGLRTTSVVQADVRDLSKLGDQSVLYYKGKGRSGKNEIVHIPYELEKLIRKYLNERAEDDPQAPLFAGLGNNNTGKRMTTRGLRKLIKTRFHEIGIEFTENLTTHSLRASCIIIGLDQDATLEEMREVVGHKSLDQTSHYQRIRSKAITNTEQKIFDAIYK